MLKRAEGNVLSRLKSSPLATRMLGLILLVSSVFTLLGVGLQLGKIYDNGLREIDARVEGVRLSIAPGLSLALWNFDSAQVNLQLDSLLQLPDIVAADVSWNAAGKEMQQRALRPGASLNDVSEWVALPLNHQGNAIGQLELGLSHKRLVDDVQQQAWLIALVQAGKTFLVSIAILLIVQWLYTRHLNQIAHHARTLGLANLGAPLQLHRPRRDRRDELDEVVDAINSMRERILLDIQEKADAEALLSAERMQLEQVRQQQMEQAIEARAKSELLATISHEIRTPMNGVIGMVQLLKDSPLSEQQQEYLRIIESCGDTLLCVINDVLDFSKLAAGKLELVEREFNLDELLHNTALLFRESLRERPIILSAAAAPGLPRQLLADDRRIQQILFNLIGNAVKFTESGHVRVYVDGKLDGPSYLLQLSVEDTGIGIPPAAREKLFQPFVQADKNTSTRFGGTGLGLTICRQLSELMGGGIVLDPDYLSGSRMLVSLRVQVPPLAPTNQLASWHDLQVAVVGNLHMNGLADCIARLGAHIKRVETPEALVPGSPLHLICLDASASSHPAMQALQQQGATLLQIAGSPGSAGLQPPFTTQALCQTLGYKPPQPNSTPRAQRYPHLRVVAVDDNATNRFVIEQMLRKLGCEATVLASGEEALAALDSGTGRPHLVLMDVEMPGLDGYQTTQALRQREAERGWSRLPVLALSAHALAEASAQALEAGMDGYLTKPLQMNELHAVLGAIQVPASNQ